MRHPPQFDLIFLPFVFRPVLLSIALMVLQQMAGINAALFYSTDIFRLAGSNLDELVCSLILNVILVVMVFAGAVVVERLGRRLLFIISAAFCCVCLAVLGAYFAILDSDPETAASIRFLPFACLVLFVAAFSLGLGPLPWLCTSEVLPLKFRAPGSSIASCVNWTLSFIVTKTFVNMQQSMGISGAFWLFGSFCFVGILFGIFVLPETKGKTAEEIQILFEK